MSSTNSLTWTSSTLDLSKTKRIPKNLQALYDSGLKTIKDLIWIAPLRVQKKPTLSSFKSLMPGELFLGKGTITNIKLTPAFGRKGKGGTQLYNVQVILKDISSDNYLTLKWFNAYPNLKKQLESMEEFTFLAEISDYKGVLQAINPKINPKEEHEDTLVTYPTINSVSSRFIKDNINKIPDKLWETPLYPELQKLTEALDLRDLSHSFKTLHGKVDYEKNNYLKEKNKLIYLEFLIEQLKVVARKRKNKKLSAKKLFTKEENFQSFIKNFPYELTKDQDKVSKEILSDLKSGHPMMRILQGDVGSGKTTVAIATAFVALKSNSQVAIMAPTEALANQHYLEFKKSLPTDYKIRLLNGGLTSKDKSKINDDLKDGFINLIIGTHALFQKNIIFKNLGLVIIDEQHKFGVEQRQALVNKGEGVHCLIMSATPIPRTLQLARYGDLDVSTIKTLPKGRKGIKTRIVDPKNYENFFKFIYTRVELGEQIYIVTAAIEESQIDINNLMEITEMFKRIFPKLKVGQLHGRLSSDDKTNTLKHFKSKKLDIVISTSVIEVGIDNPNATVMAIFNPERFGLSSLHQLRGRVGRGNKPGFCFLITDEKTSHDAKDRLKVLEDTQDGFKIAEADLKNRGEGDLFGKAQSGSSNNKKIASIINDFEIFEKVNFELNNLLRQKPYLIDELIDHILNDKKVSYTI